MTKYVFTGETPLLYPMLADYPVPGEAQNLEVKQGDVAEFEGSPPPGPWAIAEPPAEDPAPAPKTRKVTK